MLTKTQLKKIEEIIKKRFLVFTLEAVGEKHLSNEELNLLKEAGLLNPGTRSFVGDAHTLGRIAALMPKRDGAAALTYDQVLKAAKKLKSMTKNEKAAINWAEAHVGQYIKGLRDDMVKEVSASAARTSSEAIRAVRVGVSEAIENRTTTRQLKTALFDAIDDRHRDWQRVASTEMNNSIQNGLFSQILDSHGADQLVYKRPNPDACKHCKRLYLDADGIPIIFRLSELKETNAGKRAVDWEPTVGSIHPWCRCQLHIVPSGMEFKKRRVATEGFTHDGRSYGKGSSISDAVYDTLSGDNKSKTGFDSVLEYTGRDAKPTLKRSFTDLDLMTKSDFNCICCY